MPTQGGGIASTVAVAAAAQRRGSLRCRAKQSSLGARKPTPALGALSRVIGR